MVALKLISRLYSSSSSSVKTSGLNALIVGAPGSGKGTISNWIVRDFGLTHISSGDLLRNECRSSSELGLQVANLVNRGELVPDDVMIQLIGSQLSSLKSFSWLLDGFPRTRSQAIALQKTHPVNVVIHLDVPFETIIDRVKDRWIHPKSGRIYNSIFNPPKVPGKDDETQEDLIQREDDKPSSVRKRLELFSANTEPVLDYYRSLGLCEDFHGKESKKIWPSIESFLRKKSFLSHM